MIRFLPLLLALVLAACGGDAPADSDAASGAKPAASAVGPITHVDLGPIDAALAAEGQVLFDTRCLVCHKMDSRYVGPPLGDVATRRDPAYIMNMILAPEKMLQADEDAKALFAEYGVVMTNQHLTEDETRAILEYLRQVADA